MEFVSADRSRDAEFTRGLQEYNRGVLEANKDIAAQIDKTKDDLEVARDNADEIAELTTMKVGTAIGGIGAGVLEKGARAQTEFGKFKIAKKAAEAEKAVEDAKIAARGGFTEVPTSAEERLARPAGQGFIKRARINPFAESQKIGESALEDIREAYGGGAEGYRAGGFFKGAVKQGLQPTEKTLRGEFGGEEVARGSEREAREALEKGAEKETLEKGAEKEAVAGEKAAVDLGEEAIEKAAGGAGKVIGKLAGGIARGAGVAGAALSAGTAIEGLMSGEKFEWKKQGAEIGGALLDILGTGAEFIPGGQLLGVGLQIAGTALSGAGTIEEGLSVEPKQEKEKEEAEELQAQTQKDLEAQRQQALTRVTQAGAGGAAVGREAQ
jgi:hypothetical protein